jgi:uncharacterized repeat protein (TIGR03803 family)
MTLSFVLIAAAISAQAQTFQVIESFSGRNGAQPYAGLTADGAGNFYGTTLAGGNMGCNSQLGCGTVFEMSPSGSGWTHTKLYNFQGGTDGWYPFAPVVLGPDGALYGTTQYGGYASSKQGYGTVFKLSPPAPNCGISCPWTHTILYTFTNGSDGEYPGYGPLTFDSAGNIYGTTYGGGLDRAACSFGTGRCGVVYKLTPSGGSWTESVVYSFPGDLDGYFPVGSVTFDKHGNILGTTNEGGAHFYGTVYLLTPSGTGWKEKVLHAFTGGNDGAYSVSGLVFDDSGNLWGNTSGSIGTNGGGTVFELVPINGEWAFAHWRVLPYLDDPVSNLTFSNGKLYGSNPNGGIGWGSIYEVTPVPGGLTVTTLYTFQGQNDGNNPTGSVAVDANGNILGTAALGGPTYSGNVFEITP